MYVCWCDVCSCVHTCFSELHESHTAYPRHTNGQKAHVLEGRRLLTTNLGHYRENQTLSWRVATQEVFFCREILFIESDKDDNDDDDDEADDRDDFC